MRQRVWLCEEVRIGARQGMAGGCSASPSSGGGCRRFMAVGGMLQEVVSLRPHHPYQDGCCLVSWYGTLLSHPALRHVHHHGARLAAMHGEHGAHG